MAERVCPSCFAVANGWKNPPRVRKVQRVPSWVVLPMRWALWFGGIVTAGRAFDSANAGRGSWVGVFVGLGLSFLAVVWPSVSQEKRG